MADKKISELPLLNAVSGSTVIIPVVHDGTTTKVNLSQIAHYSSQWSAKTGSANTFTGNQTIIGNLNLSGNIEVEGMITAQQYNVTYVSSSVQFKSGSTEFGDTLDDTHQFTGIVTINGTPIGAAEMNSFTASQLAVNLGISSVTGSMNTQSSSQDLVNRGISSVTGSINTTTSSFNNVFLGISSVTGAMNTQSSSQNLVNLGISTYTGSQNVINTSVNSHILLQSIQTGSQDLVNLGISTYTGSQNAVNTSVNSHILVQATQTGSQDLVNLGISTYTGSQNVINNSVNSHILVQSTQTGSQDLVNLGISFVTGSLIGITNGLMAFTASLDNTYATDAQLLPLLQATASIQFATRSLNIQTGSQDLVNLSISTYTGSQNVINNSVNSHILVQSTQTGSQDLVNLGISTFTGSIRSEVGLIEAYTASLKGAAIVSSSTQITNLGFVTSSQSASFNFIGFNTSAGVSVGVGQLAWNNSDGTLDLGMKGGNVVQQIGQEIFYEVRNDTVIQIPNGTAVFASGVTAGSGRITVEPYTADGSVREVRFLGLATENISTGVNGIVTHFGYVRGLDTRGDVVSSIAVGDETWAVGDILYAHPTVAGKLTNVKPEHAITVAIIITRHQSVGVLFVRPSSGGHLEDIHDILINTGSLTNGQVLSYNSTSGLWVNTNQINTSSFAVTSSANTFYGDQTITGSLAIKDSETNFLIEGNGFSQTYLTSNGAIVLNPGYGGVEMVGSYRTFNATDITADGFVSGEIRATNNVVSSSQQITNYNLFAVTSSANIFYGNQSITGSLRVTGSLKVGDWFHGEGVVNNAKFDIRTSVDRGLKVNGLTSADVIITAYQGAVGDNIRSMRLEASDINIYTGDGNANTGSYIGGFNTNGLAFASGKGIDFSATSNGSGTTSSELLNDYEEGTWTGTMIGTVTDPTTPVTATGTYTKIGRQVTAQIAFVAVNTTGAAGGVRVTGLPFATSGLYVGSVILELFDFTAGRTSAACYTNTGSPTIIFIEASGDDTAFGGVAHAAGTGRYLYATLTYFV
jgi:hypothetical protein